jgi:uncharacterized protein (TIGR02268 family)
VPLASSNGLLALALLTTAANAAERPPLPSCEAGDVRLELTAEALATVPALCITPELSTNLFFDSKLARVELTGREHFRRVVEAADSLTLVPSEAMRDLEPQRVTVYFADGAAPASVTFLLVVHPARAVRQADIIRQTRPVAFYQRKAEEAREEVRQCRAEKARMQTEQGGPGGLRGLREVGLLRTELGVPFKSLGMDLKPRPRNALAFVWAWSFRAGGKDKGRVAVEMAVKNLGVKPWTLVGAMLRGAKGEELTSLPEGAPVSILPGEEGGRIMVEFEATTMQAQGEYTLTLWDADGRSVILENVTFP